MLKTISKHSIKIFVGLLYLSLPLTYWNQQLAISLVVIAGISGAIFLFSFLYILARPQKTKNLLAYHLLKASELFQAYSSEGEPKAKIGFLKKCLGHVQEFSKCLGETLENARISLELPDVKQLKRLRENIMNRVYPIIQDGNITSDDIITSLSKLFFYENDYERLPELNATLEKTLTSRPPEEKKLNILTRTWQNIAFRCVLSTVAVLLLILGGIYVLKYPITPYDYWAYLGTNAATVIGSIVASSVAINLFHISRARH